MQKLRRTPKYILVGLVSAFLFGAATPASKFLLHGISITLYVTAAQGLGAIRSQMIFSTAPFFGLLLLVTVLGEAFTSGQGMAAALMAASLMILFLEHCVMIPAQTAALDASLTRRTSNK